MFNRGNQHYKKRQRRREIDIEVIDNIKELFNYSDSELASLLGVSKSQLYNYRRSGKAPADKVLAMKLALDISFEDEAKEKREQLNNIMFNGSIA